MRAQKSWVQPCRISSPGVVYPAVGRGLLKCDGTRAQTRFRLSAKRTSPFKSAGGRQFSRLLAAEVCASAVVILGYGMFRGSVEGYWSIRQFLPSLPLPCVIVCHHISAGVYLHSSISSVTITKRNADKRNASTPCSGFELVTTPWAGELRTWVIVPAVRPSVKGKAIPLQVWTDSQGSRRLRLPDFKTIGLRRW